MLSMVPGLEYHTLFSGPGMRHRPGSVSSAGMAFGSLLAFLLLPLLVVVSTNHLRVMESQFHLAVHP